MTLHNISRARRRLSVFLCVAALVSVLCSLPAYAADSFPDVSHAENIYLYNIENDQVLYSKNATDRIAPGPSVKLMTALIAIETYRDNMSCPITITSPMLAGSYGNRIKLVEGEEVTAEMLINCLIVGGANDAAGALACSIGGSIDGFVRMMNERAEQLGAVHTHYTNPTGLDNEDMYTTVEDIALLARYLSQYSAITEITAQSTYNMPATNRSAERKIYNRNYLISTAIEYKYYSPSVTGMLAGSTPTAGYCCVTTSTYSNNHYLCIVMGADYENNEYYNYVITRALLNWAYSSFSYVTVLEPTAIIAEIPVNMSAGIDHVTLTPETGVTLYLPSDVDIRSEIRRSWSLDVDSLDAPVTAGQKVGSLSLIYKGEVVARVNLVTKGSVERSAWLYTLEMLKTVFAPAWFIPFCVIVCIVIVIAAIRRFRAHASVKDHRQNR